MIEETLAQLASSPWALPLMFAVVLGDAFLVVIPGEAAVTAFGALAVSTGSPQLAAVIAVAGGAALAGDACCYALGRGVGLERWRWMRGARVQSALAWAKARVSAHTAVALFTARFVPFARLAVNLTAGASRVPPLRYFAIAGLAAFGWAAYQALVGAAIAAILPGGPVVAAIVSVAVALALGLALDAVLARRRRG